MHAFPMSGDGHKKYDDRLATAIMDSVAYAANEARILRSFEEFFSPRPASLCDSAKEEKALTLRIHRITERLGAPPKLIIKGYNEPPAKYDTYPVAAFQEVLSVFYAAR